MKKIVVYQTLDGMQHSTIAKAAAYADRQYGDQLTHIARQLTELSKYKNAVEWLEDEGNIEQLKKMFALRDDLVLEQDDEN